jgi:hypothetical protein
LQIDLINLDFVVLMRYIKYYYPNREYLSLDQLCHAVDSWLYPGELIVHSKLDTLIQVIDCLLHAGSIKRVKKGFELVDQCI